MDGLNLEEHEAHQHIIQNGAASGREVSFTYYTHENFRKISDEYLAH
jgi:hypothetical protein